MSHSETVRVLVADEVPERAEMLMQALSDCGCRIVGLAAGDLPLTEQVNRARPDVILINLESPDRDTLEQLALVTDAAPVVMFASDEARETIESAVRAGVSAYVTSGLGQSRVRAIIDVAIARFQQFRALKSDLESTRATLAGRRDVERAKGLLMEKRGCSEADAHRLLREAAMNRNQRMDTLARELLRAARVPNPPAPTPETRS